MQNGLLSQFSETDDSDRDAADLANAKPLPGSEIGLKTIMSDAEMQALLARSGKVNPAFGAKAASMFDNMAGVASTEPVQASTLTGLPSSLNAGAEIIVEPPSETMIIEPEPAPKKDHITITLNGSSPFLPPAVVYLGTSNSKANYVRWLNARIKEVLTDLGEKTNRKGNISKRYGQAVRFIRSAIAFLETEAEYNTVSYKYVGLPLPRDIGFIETLKTVLHENKVLILALAPYFNPKPVPVVEETKPAEDKAPEYIGG